MVAEGVEELEDGLVVAGMDAHPRIDERTDEPGPDRALVVGGVT